MIIAKFYANIYCLFHPWCSVYRETVKPEGCFFYRTVYVAAVTGSIRDNSLKIIKEFYNNENDI